MQTKTLINKLGFTPKENASGVFSKHYSGNYTIEIDVENQSIDFGNKIKEDSKTSQNFSQEENWVVLECVNRLLEKGYKPENIILEKTWKSGHGHSGRLDICVTRDDGSEYMLIECKTYGSEFDKALKELYKKGGQLFTYFKFSNKADVILLYASDLKGGDVVYRNEIIKIEDEYRTGDVYDFYEKWNKLTKDNGVFDSWVAPYDFVSKALTSDLLEPIKADDSSFIFNRFLEILRHNVVSDKPNAFNKIFNLFLCKVYDEKSTKLDEELKFQWLEGVDDHISFQLRLSDLYKKGMKEFLEKEVSDFSKEDFDRKYGSIDQEVRDKLLDDIFKLRLQKNNEFAIKEVYDDKSFDENAKVVKEVVELLQNYRIRYNKRQQYLSDFFELLLTTGLKQESGQFFTPVPIARFIIKSLPLPDLIDEKLAKGERNNLLPHIMDYAAGSGHFLTESMHEIQRILGNRDAKDYIPDTGTEIDKWQRAHFDWATKYVYGIEKDYRLVKVGKVGCYLHGDGLANVILSDGLASFENEEYKGVLKHKDKDFPSENKKFDVVISNPPYSVSSFKNTARDYYREKDFELYEYLTDNSSEIECLFIERTKQLLKDGGIAGIILPSSILSNSGIYTKAREMIFDYFDVIGITEFGSNTFMATGTNTVTLFLKRKNNYETSNLKNAVAKFFTNLQDVTTNGIEHPVEKYVAYVWESISLKDYKTLLQQSPNTAIDKHELYIEYRKKLKTKNEKEFWEKLLALEQEKLYYFIKAYPQNTILVKTGSKAAEKKFLGYEFSQRRGSEGIHAIQRGKEIEDCTQLFDEAVFDNPEKASTYIYKAFKGETDLPIAESLAKNVSRIDLVDMLTFDRADFDKSISLSVKKKVKIESKWDLVNIRNVADTQYGYTDKAVDEGEVRYLRITDLNDDGSIKTNNEAKYINPPKNIEEQFILNDKDIVIARSGSVGKSAIYKADRYDKMIFASYLIRLLVNEEKILPHYLFYYTQTQYYWDQVEANSIAVTQPNLNAEKIKNIKIPLPSKDIQEQIVSEIEALEDSAEKMKTEIGGLKEEIISLFLNSQGKFVRLEDITSKIGSGATPRGGEGSYQNSGITLIRSQNIHDSLFTKKGLAFINKTQAKKLDNVSVEKNDILFNITGASVARCCLVNEKYLPARVNQHVSIIRVNENAIPKYVQLVLVSDEFKKRLLEIAEGGTSRQAITKSQLENFKIPLPPLSEQEKIVSEIEQIEEKINKLEKDLQSIPSQKEDILKKHL